MFFIIIIFLGVLWAGVGILKILGSKDYFKIKEIMTNEDNTIDGSTMLTINPERSRGIDLSYLKGKNIFSIDLRQESQDIVQQNPVYRKIRLIRVIPNRIFVDFIRRKPIALIKLYRYFAVDEEGMVFEVPKELDYAQLPLILGLETKIFGAKSGRIYKLKELALALDIIREAKNNQTLRGYKIKIINVTDINNASFFLLLTGGFEGLEIKLDADELKEKFAILTGILSQDKENLVKIKYIDLRFKEPVIKLKNVK